jgi:hypothetical protein
MRAVSNVIRNAWGKYRALSGAQRELALLALALLFALTVLPLVIWIAGRIFMGDYVREPAGGRTGGPLALWIDYVQGIATGSPGHWIVLLGPYVILKALRVCRSVLKM